MAARYKAPLTNKLTVVFEFQLATEDRPHLMIVHSLYPGEDIGELSGDITENEGRVFFDWDHPGADDDENKLPQSA
jgi:hypothetical protein